VEFSSSQIEEKFSPLLLSSTPQFPNRYSKPNSDIALISGTVRCPTQQAITNFEHFRTFLGLHVFEHVSNYSIKFKITFAFLSCRLCQINAKTNVHASCLNTWAHTPNLWIKNEQSPNSVTKWLFSPIFCVTMANRWMGKGGGIQLDLVTITHSPVSEAALTLLSFFPSTGFLIYS